LERALKIGVSALFAIALAIAGIFVLFSRKAEKENTLAHMVIAQLQRGLQTQDQFDGGDEEGARRAGEERFASAKENFAAKSQTS